MDLNSERETEIRIIREDDPSFVHLNIVEVPLHMMQMSRRLEVHVMPDGTIFVRNIPARQRTEPPAMTVSTQSRASGPEPGTLTNRRLKTWL